MIQRIQTIYLFLSALLISLMHVFPVAKLHTGPGGEIIFRSFGFFNELSPGVLIPSLPVLLLLGVVALLYLIAIFLFRNRNLQARVCRLNFLLLIGSLGLMAYYVLHVYRQVEAVGLTIKIAALFPLITIVLTWLAVRGIIKDENLVRSVDKIR